MWEPRRLTILWASTACYRDNFAFTYLFVYEEFWEFFLSVCLSVVIYGRMCASPLFELVHGFYLHSVFKRFFIIGECLVNVNSSEDYWVCGLCPSSDIMTFLLEYDALRSVESQPGFYKNISPPSSGSKNWRRKIQRASRRHTLVSSSDYSSILKIETKFLRNVL
jgi:hypothetical protein